MAVKRRQMENSCKWRIATASLCAVALPHSTGEWPGWGPEGQPHRIKLDLVAVLDARRDSKVDIDGWLEAHLHQPTVLAEQGWLVKKVNM
eukprot:7169776-Prymnesium_polylepis.1